MTLAERLKWAREQTGMSARALDKLAHLHGGHTTLIETRRRKRPDSETVRALARALGVSLDWLIDGNGMAPSEQQLQAMARAS